MRVLTYWIPSWLVSGRRMKIVSNSRSVPGSSLIDIVHSSFLDPPFRGLTLLPRIEIGWVSPIYRIHGGGHAFFHHQFERIGGTVHQRCHFLLLLFRKRRQ